MEGCSMSMLPSLRRGWLLVLAAAFSALIVALALPHRAAAQDYGFSGTWSTSEGRMELDQRRGHVSGSYSQDAGRIEGEVRGGRLEGHWAEAGSGQRCSYERMGSYYWGRIDWTLSHDGRRFEGRWSYCDGEATRSWSGDRVGGGRDHVMPGREEKVFDNTNPAACGFTDRASLRLDRPLRLTRLELWLSWDRGERTASYSLERHGEVITRGVLRRTQCDPYQRQWCNAEDSPQITLAPGRYVLRLSRSNLCQNAASNGEGFVRLWGRWR